MSTFILRKGFFGVECGVEVETESERGVPYIL